MVDASNLRYIITHVFLPPKLPQHDDSDPTKSAALAEELLAALRAFETYSTQQDLSVWMSLIKMVEETRGLRDTSGGLNPDKLERGLLQMIDGGMIT